MGRPALTPKPEEVDAWRKRTEEKRSLLFNGPCKKKSGRFLSSRTVRELEEEALRSFLADTFDLVTIKKE
jgi:hypothetical protein